MFIKAFHDVGMHVLSILPCEPLHGLIENSHLLLKQTFSFTQFNKIIVCACKQTQVSRTDVDQSPSRSLKSIYCLEILTSTDLRKIFGKSMFRSL